MFDNPVKCYACVILKRTTDNNVSVIRHDSSVVRVIRLNSEDDDTKGKFNQMREKGRGDKTSII